MTAMSASSLTVPLTFPPDIELKEGGGCGDATISSCLYSPTCLVAWGYSSQVSPEDSGTQSSPQGVAIGCEDGTLYIFHRRAVDFRQKRQSIETAGSPSADPGGSSRATSRLRYTGLGRPHSRSASPSSAHSTVFPFHVPRSAVVSSVSTDQVEAPKNYVDFDEEPEKLKGMLKGKAVKEKVFNDLLSPTVDGAKGGDKPSSSRSGRGVRAISASSMRSVSPPSSPSSPTLVASPPVREAALLSLSCHVLPPSLEKIHAVTALKSFDNGRYVICLQQSGDVTVYASADGSCGASASTGNSLPSTSQPAGIPSTMWTWNVLHIALWGESNIIAACASADTSYSASQSIDTADGDSEAQTRMSIYEVRTGPQTDGGDMSLVKLGECYLDGPAESIVLHHEADGTACVVYASSHHLFLRSINIHDTSSPLDKERSNPSSNLALPIPNPFKAFQGRSREQVAELTEADNASIGIVFSDPVKLGDISLIGPTLGTRSIAHDRALRIMYWSESHIMALELDARSVRHLFLHPLIDVNDLSWINADSFVAAHSDRADMYLITRVDANHDHLPDETNSDETQIMHPEVVRSVPLSPYDCCSVLTDGAIMYTGSGDKARRIEHISMEEATANSASRIIWKAPGASTATPLKPRVTSLLPIEFADIILGCSDGYLRRSCFAQVVNSRLFKDVLQTSNAPLQGNIIALDTVESERTKQRFIVGGADDGSVAIWDLESLRLCARWTIFTTSFAKAIRIQGERVGRLRGCVLCISQDGTIAVIAIDDFQLVFLVPASIAPLRKVHVREDNILLLYTDGRARLWDTKTMEFWRSMSEDKADELLKQGGWTGWSVDATMSTAKPGLSTIAFPGGLDCASTLLLDVEAVIRLATASYLTSPTQPKSTVTDTLRSSLAALLTSGLSKEIDGICRTKLGVDSSFVQIGHTRNGASSLYMESSPQSVWSISPDVSALRSLALISVLHAFLHHEELLSDATTVMTFYATSLTEAVGPTYKPPSLSFLARNWLLSSVIEVRNAARLLFDTGVARLSNEETLHMVEDWQPYLPCLHFNMQESFRNAMALHICGFIAIEKYSLLPTSVLIDISKSVALFLHDDESTYRALAIELCSRGFTLWQQYVDAVEMLRALFTLATTSRKETVSLQNIGSQARTAVLRIASTNTPLFMTTLTIDILQPRSVQHRKAVMQLVIFLIRKKPLVLYGNLPRLVEAVVKSLDPNSTSSRDAVLDSATDILGHIVQTFPTVDFHTPSQRLAVGTSEGAVVMYDLKTATRLYVLEGHKKRTTACSFSPDGRRLVTVSLEESAVLVWKVGSSLTSFFNPGAPPRQGHGGSEPFKTLNFNIGTEAVMSLAATLDNVRFEWPADRSVKLKIREVTLTFST